MIPDYFCVHHRLNKNLPKLANNYFYQASTKDFSLILNINILEDKVSSL